VQSVPASLAVRANPDQTGFSQNLEVLGDARLAELEAGHELVDRPLPVAQEVEDLAARRFCERRVGSHGLILPNGHMNEDCSGIR
jgi:hypothetical protein